MEEHQHRDEKGRGQHMESALIGSYTHFLISIEGVQ